MCGITGFNLKLSKEYLSKMTGVVSHRGPDAEGYYYNEEMMIALGHRRLSILDLSSQANQPFFSSNGRYVMVYNGEVFNYKEIARDLNIKQKTTSDTEVILEAFALEGPDFISRLNGMFAMAIYDTNEQILYLFRDRLGIKPLYYYLSAEGIAFGSELKSIKQLPLKFSLCQPAITNFLHLGYIPEGLTIYNEVKKFPAGSYGVFGKEKQSFHLYWQAEQKISFDVVSDKKRAQTTLKELIEKSVERRMISDVPLGTFLSGGTDSSLVTAVAQSLSPTPVKTFSIGFKENKFNEAEHSKKVANFLGTEHFEYILDKQQALDEFYKLTNTFDEPFADSSAIPTLLLSQMARKEVTVALSGDGGDELFMGYGSYEWANRLNNIFLKNFRKPIYESLNMVPFQKIKRGAKVFNYPDEKKIRKHIFSQEQYLFTEDEVKCIFKSFSHGDLLNDELYRFGRSLSARENQSLFDIKHYLKDDLLVKVDRASMQHGLEVRVPLLDYQLVEYAVNLDEKLKVRNGVSKYLLKELLYDYIPKRIVDRKKKGFSIPLANWLQTDLRFLGNKYLAEDIISRHGLFNTEYILKIKNEFYNQNANYHYAKIWSLITLFKFLEEQF